MATLQNVDVTSEEVLLPEADEVLDMLEQQGGEEIENRVPENRDEEAKAAEIKRKRKRRTTAGCKYVTAEEYEELMNYRENAKKVKIITTPPKCNFRFGSIDLDLNPNEEDEKSAHLYLRDRYGRRCNKPLKLFLDDDDLSALKEDKHCLLKDVLNYIDNEQYHVVDGSSQCKFVRANVGKTEIKSNMEDLENSGYVSQLKKYLYENTPYSYKSVADMGLVCPDEELLCQNGKVYVLPGGRPKTLYKARPLEEEEEEVLPSENKQEEKEKQEKEDEEINLTAEEKSSLIRWMTTTWNADEAEVVRLANEIYKKLPPLYKEQFKVWAAKYNRFKKRELVVLDSEVR